MDDTPPTSPTVRVGQATRLGSCPHCWPLSLVSPAELSGVVAPPAGQPVVLTPPARQPVISIPPAGLPVVLASQPGQPVGMGSQLA